MIRLASVLIAVGLVPVGQALFEVTGATATRCTFLGTPLIVAGVALVLVARLRGARSPD